MIVERADVMLSVEPRSFDSFLRIHPELDDVQENLQQSLILIVAAGRAQYHERLTVLENQRRRKGDARTFAGRDYVRTVGIGQRRLQTLPHQDAGISGNDGG